jgi:hypothetical protein
MGSQGGPGGQADHLALGDYNAVCSMCGRKRKASQMVKNWQGQYRCPWHNEIRQPQDFTRNIKDIQTVPWAQPEEILFVAVCDLYGISALPGYAIPGCSLPGNDAIPPTPSPPLGFNYLAAGPGDPFTIGPGGPEIAT